MSSKAAGVKARRAWKM